jgi:hypothetical protein
MGQNGSKRFTTTVLRTLQLLYYYQSHMGRAVHLAPAALWVVMAAMEFEISRVSPPEGQLQWVSKHGCTFFEDK